MFPKAARELLGDILATCITKVQVRYRPNVTKKLFLTETARDFHVTSFITTLRLLITLSRLSEMERAVGYCVNQKRESLFSQ